MPQVSRNADPDWYRDAIIYELHVRAFYDSNADGIGDFPGLIQKLDYLHDLGVTALWLLPFYPSPLKDDGYDIADYTDIHPAYGTLRDFKAFLNAAHDRGMRIVIELVLNHTSDQHPWFQRARHAPPGSRWRDFYVWSDSPDRYREARVIFQDFERSNWSWDPIAEAYYWHRFYSHQPDLNYDNPAVRRAIFKVVDFWLDLGIDGLRLDAVPYLAEQEGTSSENLPRTHAFLKDLRRHVDERYADRMLLAEANQWPEDAVAYFGDGDECHMAFHFPLMPRLFMALKIEDRLPILDIMAQTPPIPEGCQWALFLRNHDELTLEMVTDEERLYMYRVFAETPEARFNLGIRRRLAPLLGNSRRRIELMTGLLLSLPGTPVIYYGDEIGMGDNVYLGDRDGVRTPMQWSTDRNAGFSRAHPQQLYLPLIVDHEYHHATIHVEAQARNPHSLLAFTRRLLALRKRYRAFGRGSLEFLPAGNRRVLAFVRRLDDECILVVANLSRFAQAIELDLSAFRGLLPIELFGRSPFWPIDDAPYHLTLGPHAFYWFSLEPATAELGTARVGSPGERMPRESLPTIRVDRTWEEAVIGRGRSDLERALPAFLAAQPWFAGKHYRLLAVAIEDAIPVATAEGRAYLALVRVLYADADPETYLLPLASAAAEDRPVDQATGARVAWVRMADDAKVALIDASESVGFSNAVRDFLGGATRTVKGVRGAVTVRRTRAGRATRLMTDGDEAQALLCETSQHNTSLFFADQLVLKLLRRIDEGTNPEVELGALLTDRGFAHAPPLLAWLDYRSARAEPTTLAVLHGYVPHDRDGWTLALEAVDTVLSAANDGRQAPSVNDPSVAGLLHASGTTPPAALLDVAGPWLAMAERLGTNTARLHRALADSTEPSFAPAPLTPFAQRSLYQSIRGSAARLLRELHEREPSLPEDIRPLAAEILDHEFEILERLRPLLARPIEVARIRCHGNLHLGQVLHAGGDFVIIDLEGEPERSIAERRLKAVALRDVAEMIRSFDYVAETVSVGREGDEVPAASGHDWARAWYHWTAAAFLAGYFAKSGDAPFVPRARIDQVPLLDTLLIERALAEIGFELVNRPDRLPIPLRGLLLLLASAPG